MNSVLSMSFDLLIDTIADTLPVVPFLLLVYLLMEWLEHKAEARTIHLVRRAGVAGPFVAALLGALPQCGFSAVGATLYAGRVITLGTLFAVFLSTSDHMLPVMIAQGCAPQKILLIVGSKVLIGMVIGFAIDAIFHARDKSQGSFDIRRLCEQDHCECNDVCAADKNNTESNEKTTSETYPVGNGITTGETYPVNNDKTTSEKHPVNNDKASSENHIASGNHTIRMDNAELYDGHCCTKKHVHRANSSHQATFHIIKSAVIHTIKVTVFLFLISLVLSVAFLVFDDTAKLFMCNANPVIMLLFTGIVGLFPNCAVSVLITQLYLEGLISTAAMMTGLLVSAGIGFQVLFRTNRRLLENMCIVAGLYVVSVLVGLLFLLFNISF